MRKSKSRRLFAVLGAIVAVAVAGAAFAQQDALNSPARTPEEHERDKGSKPLEVYAFFGVEPGMTIADLMPSSGYNTYILTNIVGDGGKIYAGPDRGDRLAERMQSSPLANVEMISGFGDLPAGELDVIITIRNVHDLEGRGPATDTYKQWLAALKPGGILGVVDARTAKEGYDSDTHRINQQTVIDSITAAGFELVEASEMLANPNDDFGKYEGMGVRTEIDRMALKFRKAQ